MTNSNAMLCNIDDELCTYAQSGKQLQYKQQKQYCIVVNIIFVIDERLMN